MHVQWSEDGTYLMTDSRDYQIVYCECRALPSPLSGRRMVVPRRECGRRQARRPADRHHGREVAQVALHARLARARHLELRRRRHRHQQRRRQPRAVLDRGSVSPLGSILFHRMCCVCACAACLRSDDNGYLRLFQYPTLTPSMKHKGSIGHSSHVTDARFNIGNQQRRRRIGRPGMVATAPQMAPRSTPPAATTARSWNGMSSPDQ